MLSSAACISPTAFARDVFKYDDAIGQIAIDDPATDGLLDFINIDSITGLYGSEEINASHGERPLPFSEDEQEDELDVNEFPFSSRMHLQPEEWTTNFEGAVVEGENANEELEVMASMSSFVKVSSPSSSSSTSQHHHQQYHHL